MFSFVKNHQTVLERGCTILHSQQQWMRVPVIPHPQQHLVLSVFWILATPNKYVVVTHCFNLYFPDDIWGEALLICLFAICISSLVRCLLRSFIHFSIELFVFFLLSFKSCFFFSTLDNSPLADVSFAVFSPSLWIVFSFFWQSRSLQSRSFSF